MHACMHGCGRGRGWVVRGACREVPLPSSTNSTYHHLKRCSCFRCHPVLPATRSAAVLVATHARGHINVAMSAYVIYSRGKQQQPTSCQHLETAAVHLSSHLVPRPRVKVLRSTRTIL